MITTENGMSTKMSTSDNKPGEEEEKDSRSHEFPVFRHHTSNRCSLLVENQNVDNDVIWIL